MQNDVVYLYILLRTAVEWNLYMQQETYINEVQLRPDETQFRIKYNSPLSVAGYKLYYQSHNLDESTRSAKV